MNQQGPLRLPPCQHQGRLQAPPHKDFGTRHHRRSPRLPFYSPGSWGSSAGSSAHGPCPCPPVFLPSLTSGTSTAAQGPEPSPWPPEPSLQPLLPLSSRLCSLPRTSRTFSGSSGWVPWPWGSCVASLRTSPSSRWPPSWHFKWIPHRSCRRP